MRRLRDRRADAELLTDPAPDVRATPWYQFVSELAALRMSGDYMWAEEALAGIQQTVERTHHVTAGQVAAVAGIVAKERLPGRAYDVWGRGRRW